MKDPRYTKLANVLVKHSCKVRRGEKVLIEAYDIPIDFPGYRYMWHFHHHTDNPIFWRPDPRGPYQRFTDDDRAALEQRFRDHGRAVDRA